ncbi:Siroheme synthase [Sulfuracidifex tepidarius]|uniref:Siroheme synthase n=1 Tax=Sulfuracidifex tepidarius TaxID=1294262 RepID=A0A510DVV6_9CREN|nr:cobalt-factor II C(20)-methyltransferase [Sulfuracidifex tepidarius]BBG24314.1 Siroheme synthase [Sulfuracidifex tepidarius]
MRLSVVGLGPGDPELLTLKAIKRMDESKVIFVPYSSGTGRSLAMEVIKDHAKGRIVQLGFPMGDHVDDEDLKRIGEKMCLEAEDPSSFVTLGDPVLYSTYFRVKDFLPCFDQIELIPGVSSVTACACKAFLNLGSEKEAIAIIPSLRRDLLELAKGKFETIIVLKGSKGLEEASEILNGYQLIYARRCFMDGELISKWSGKSDHDYFSMLIARR